MLAVAYATVRASHARQFKADDPDNKGYSGPPGWGLGVRLTTPPHKKILLRDLKRRPRSTQGCRADDDDDYMESRHQRRYCPKSILWGLHSHRHTGYITGLYITGLGIIGLHITGLYIIGLYITGLYITGLYITGLYIQNDLSCFELLYLFKYYIINKLNV
jgi:hypothetical protein